MWILVVLLGLAFLLCFLAMLVAWDSATCLRGDLDQAREERNATEDDLQQEYRRTARLEKVIDLYRDDVVAAGGGHVSQIDWIRQDGELMPVYRLPGAARPAAS